MYTNLSDNIHGCSTYLIIKFTMYLECKLVDRASSVEVLAVPVPCCLHVDLVQVGILLVSLLL